MDIFNKEFSERFQEWLWAQFNRGKYGVVFDRLSHGGRVKAFRLSMEVLLEEIDPIKDKEFMERVGERLVDTGKREGKV